MPGIGFILIYFFLVTISQAALDKSVSDAFDGELAEVDWSDDLLDLRNSNVQGRTTVNDQECSCTYDFSNGFVKARLGHRLLKEGDSIRRGETVSFECRYVNTVLTWEIGLRFYGRANMTCNTCEKWQKQHLPTCRSAQQTDVVLGQEDDLAVLPGGAVELQRGQSRRFSCNNIWRQPEWVYRRNNGVSVKTVEHSEDRETIFVSYLEITDAKDKHGGIYECYSRSPAGHQTLSTFLRIEVVRKSDSTVENCTKIPYTRGLRIYYSGFSVGSIARFMCLPSTRKLMGSSNSTCLKDGTWSNPAPVCNGYVQDDPEHFTANLGEGVILRCAFEFPENKPVPYVIQWQKQGIKTPIYIWYDGYPPHASDGYEGRVSLAHQASLNLTNVHESDQGWYECKVFFLNMSPDPPQNGTWVHLDVHENDGTTFTSPETGVSPTESTISTSREIPDDGNNRECSCEFNPGNRHHPVVASVGDKRLQKGDIVRHGDTVSFHCLRSEYLSWVNGIQYRGSARMTCSKCEVWTDTELPTCQQLNTTRHIAIRSREELSFLPGGILQMREGESCNIFCFSNLSRSPPRWVYETETKDNVVQRRDSFRSLLEIKHAKSDNNGEYRCVSSAGVVVGVLNLEVDSKSIDSTVVNCTKIPYTPGLRIYYSGFSVGSIARFRCSPSTRKLSGSSNSTCLEDGTWSNPAPMCDDPKCSIEDLYKSLPFDVTLDTPNVDEFSLGSEVQLKCEESIMLGDSTALCGESGRWQVDNLTCVPGCRLDVNPSSKLRVEPRKNSYRIGEFVFLSCPLGYMLSNDVELLMCLSNGWSSFLPECIPVTDKK